MAGLLQGNPYYSGPSPLAAGVNAFADNFMKGTEFFQKMDNDKINNQILQAKLGEYQNEQKMRDELQAYQAKGLMAPAGGPQQPMPKLNDFGGGMGAGSMGAPMAQPGMEMSMGVAPIQADPSIQGIPQAASPRSSELESLQGMMAIMSKYNPEKGLALRSQLATATNKAELAQALLDFKIAAQDAKNQYGQQLMELKMKMAEDREKKTEETIRHNTALETLKAIKGSGGGEGGGKSTEFDRDYKDYVDWFNQTTGNPQHPSYNPGVAKFSRGAYREYKVRQEAGAKTAGQLEGIRGSMGGPAPQKAASPSAGPTKMVWNPAKGRFE